MRGRGVAPRYRDCPVCGAHLRSNYLKKHQKDHCKGRPEGQEEEEEDGEGAARGLEEEEGAVGGQEEQEEDGEGAARGLEEEEGAVGGLLEVAEALGLVNEVNQTLLGERRRTGRWRVEEEEEEDEALWLQQHLTQQALQVCR